MKILIRTSLFAILSVFLSGCGSPQIEKKYDDFSKKHVCRLTNYLLKNAWGRPTHLTLEREGDYIKGFISVHGINGKYNFSNNPDVTFNIYKKNNLVESIKLKATTMEVKSWMEPTYGTIVSINIPHSNATSLIRLSKEDFIKIAYADHVQFSISGKNDSMEGNITSSELEFFRKFDKECAQAQ